MKKIALTVFAVIGILSTLAIALSGLGVWVWLERDPPKPEAPKEMVLLLDFTHDVTEQPRGLDLTLPALLRDHDETPLLTILRALDRAKTDPRVKGVVARFGSLQPSLSTTQEVRSAMETFRKSGKPTMAYGTNYGTFGGGNKAYLLASAFEEIWLQPTGTVGLTGLGLEAPFGKKMFDEIGIKATFSQREEYKSFMENAMRESYSAPVKENMTSLIENLKKQELEALEKSRGLGKADAEAVLADGPYTAEEALKRKLITRIGYRDEVEKEMDKKAGEQARWVSPSSYLAFAKPSAKTKKATSPKATIALITAEGIITEDPSTPARLTKTQIMDSDRIAGALEDAAQAKEVKAIFLRINSPGGSPSAAETIRRAVVTAKEAGKPVYVSMGEMAASGGYWIAMNADHIVADPSTLTGSIGVIGGKFSVAALAQKLGITWDRITTSPNATMWSFATDFTPAQKERLDAFIDDSYNTFTKNVAEARHLPLEKKDIFAKGRVFTGEQAKEIGLVDELGGYRETLVALKKKLGLKPDEKVAFERFPAPETPASLLFKMLKNIGLQSLSLQSALSMWGRIESTPLASALETTLQAAEGSPVQARLPLAYGNGF